MTKTTKVHLTLPKAVYDDLSRRITGTSFSLDAYINALLTVQVVHMINTERADAQRWKERT